MKSLQPRLRTYTLAILGMIIGLPLCAPTATAKDDVEKAGDVLRAIIPLAGLGATLFYEDGSEGPLQFIQSYAVTQIVTHGLKGAIDKRRPNGECCEAFPSGHTSTAFMGAAFIHKRYGWDYALPAYLGAGFVGYSRIHADKHDMADVLVGAAIGMLSSFAFTTTYKGITLTPQAGGDFMGLRLSTSW
ncbi:phosphatase PAP2 family protein [Luteithermobacter gelatinilyticus]|uniref:phosphatase PAP2 family protein n=1 Tax=Luteithermobacter gelatinilyticus TaxID=2582913 RepID=UPI001AF02965|nr:phosphatase PAP2 family protein [Luteithermobacter gelatinilyticus]